MDSIEMLTGIIVTFTGVVIMVYAIYKVWQNEKRNPTEDITNIQ